MRTKITALLTAAAAAASAAGAATWAKRRKATAEPEPEATPPVEAPPVSPDPASDPPASGSAPAASSGAAPSDDLTAIKGLGKVKAAKLVASGITSYAQIAAWSDDDIAEAGLTGQHQPGPDQARGLGRSGSGAGRTARPLAALVLQGHHERPPRPLVGEQPALAPERRAHRTGWPLRSA